MLLLLGLTSLVPPAAWAQQIRQAQDPVPGQYVVVLKDQAASKRGALSKAPRIAAQLKASYGGRIQRVYQHALNGYSVQMTRPEALALSKDTRVDFVEEDGRAYAVDTQTNPPWGLDRIDQRDRPLNNAYTYSATGAGVNAYVIDTGINATHQQFGGRATRSFDAFGGNGADGNGHGTHVAGTIGGATYGVAKNVRLYGVRVLDNSGSGTWSGVIAGVDWVTASHIKPAVANMSLGPLNRSVVASLDTDVRNSIASGVTYVIAAGNNGEDASYCSPARVGEAITVGATDINDNRAGFSNYGFVLDVFAPGVDILSAWIGSDTATATLSGTSMAAPHVAGAAALYLQNNPGAAPATVSMAIIIDATPDKVGNPGPGSPNRLLFYGPTGVYKIRNRNSGQVLEIGGGGSATITDGTAANQWPSLGTANQEWNLTVTSDGTYKIINRNSGLMGMGRTSNGPSTRSPRACLRSSIETAIKRWKLVRHIRLMVRERTNGPTGVEHTSNGF